MAPQDDKERQRRKLRELADAVDAVAGGSLAVKAEALGLSRSTTWTILKAQHKNYGLSRGLIARLLRKPDLDPQVRAKLIEYVNERATGVYGHSGRACQRWASTSVGTRRRVPHSESLR